MSTTAATSDPLVDSARNEIRRQIHAIAQLAQSDVPQAEFYQRFLTQLVDALAAVGGVIWAPGDEGPRAECVVGLTDRDLGEEGDPRAQHARLLLKTLADGEPRLMAPLSGVSADEAWGNPTEHLLLIAPLRVGGQVTGLVEIFQRPGKGPVTQRGYLKFVVDMAEVAGGYLQKHQLRQYGQRQELWKEWERFARAVHATLDPRQTAFTIANEARRLLDCDRVSVALRQGSAQRVEAVSGQDVLDRRATAVSQLEQLAAAVAATGEALCYNGDTRELAPQIEKLLQAYLDTSHAKTVAVFPLHRTGHDRPAAESMTATARAARGLADEPALGVLIVEQIGEALPREDLLQRASAVRDHSALALANATEHHDVFLMPLWKTLGRARGLVSGGAWPKTAAVAGVLAAAAIALAVVPADFELEGRGTLQPVVRREVFAGVDGVVQAVHARHGDMVQEGDLLAELRNVDLEVQIADLAGQRATTLEKLGAVELALLGENRLSEIERNRLHGERLESRQTLASIDKQLGLLEQKRKLLEIRSPIAGQVVTWNVADMLIRRPVHRGDALLSVVDPRGDWELEVRMPEDRMGHVARAARDADKPLDVSYIVATDPGTTLTGHIDEIHQNAEVRGDDGNTVLVTVSINRDDLHEPRPGAEVTARVACGRRSLGYVWLHDLVAFIQSRILFRL